MNGASAITILGGGGLFIWFCNTIFALRVLWLLFFIAFLIGVFCILELILKFAAYRMALNASHKAPQIAQMRDAKQLDY